MADSKGTDAIYVVDYTIQEGLIYLGHARLYIQDENGKWFFTEFSGVNFDKRTATIKVFNVKPDNAQFQAMLNGEEIKGIDYVYIKGDFTASLDVAKSYEGSNYGGYKLFTNNCLHYIQEVLRAGAPSNDYDASVIKKSNNIVPSSYYYEFIATRIENQVR